MVMSVLPVFALSSTAAKAYSYTATNADGDDVTDDLTDGNIEDYLDGHATWYHEPVGYTWTVENGRLVIAGIGDVSTSAGTAASYPWYTLRDEITEVVVFPNSIDSIGKNAFASLSKLTYVEIGTGLDSIGEGALACGAEDLTVVVPSGLVSAAEAALGSTNGTVSANTATTLTIAPVDYGFENREGATELSFTLKNGSTPFAVPEGYSWRVFISDGEKVSEGGTYFSSAMKLIVADPSSAEAADGLYRYEVCNLEGENQFIPQYYSSYVIGVQLYDEDGKLAYTAVSGRNQFQVHVDPIYEARTSALVTNGYCQHIELDLGASKPIGDIEVAFLQYSTRVYNWVAYGTNDNTLPLSKWTFLGEKQNDVVSDGSYKVEVGAEAGSFRYVRVYGTYHSGNWGLHFSEIAIHEPPPAYLETEFTATDFYGEDWTEYMSDGNYSEYLGYWGEHTWYDIPDGYAEDIDPAYVWTVEQGRLYIGGIGAVTTEEKTAESYPWYSLRNEITEVIVFPGTVESIDDNAFASLSKVTYIEVGAGVTTIGDNVFASGANGVVVSVPNTISSIGQGVLNGCTNVTIVINNASVMDFLTYVSIGTDNEELDTANFIENTVTQLNIDSVGAGFDNVDGTTELSFTLKNGSSDFEVPEGYSWKLLIYDGKRYSRESADYICSAIKIISVDPTSIDGNTYTYAVCELEGENQFIPQYECAYMIVAQLYDENGNIAYTATSSYNEFTMDVTPIYTERTAALTTNSRHGYILLDLGESLPVGKLNVGFCQASRYYQWVAYGSNDKDLPLSKWTFLGEKMNNVTSSGSYAVDVDPGDDGYESFRYVRIECTYNSANWGAHFAEVDVFVVASLCEITWVVDGVSTTTSVMEGVSPVMEDPIKDPEYDGTTETNYVFLGWSDGETLYKVGTDLPKVTGPVTYTAVFEKLTESWLTKGDVDESGSVTIADVAATLDIIAGKRESTAAADVNGDDSVTIADVAAILDIIAGKG